MKKKGIIVGRVLKVRAAWAVPAPNAILAQVEAREAPSGLVSEAPSTFITPDPETGMLLPSPQDAPNSIQPPPTVMKSFPMYTVFC